MKNNFEKHIQPDSKTPITALPAKMISARIKNNKQMKRVQKRKIVSLTKHIGILKAKFKESVTVTLDGSDDIDFLGNEDKVPPENDCGSSDDSEEEDVTQHQNFMAEMESKYLFDWMEMIILKGKTNFFEKRMAEWHQQLHNALR